MDSASAISIAAMAFTITAIVFSRRSGTRMYVAGATISFLLVYYLTSGDMAVVMDELSWNYNYNEPWRLLTACWNVFNPILFVVNMAFLFIVGSILDRRVSNIGFALILIGSSVLGLCLWSGFITNISLIGTSFAVAGVMGASVTMFTRLRVVLPRTGDTRVQVWHVVLLWVVFMCASTYFFVGGEYVNYIVVHFIIMGFGGLFALALDSMRLKSVFVSLRADKHVNIEALKDLCVTDSQISTYRQMEELDDPFLVDLWAEAFVKKLSCPKCGKRYSIINYRVVCQNGHFLK